MALSIVNNPTAIGAQGGVNSVNSKLAKTIKSLSTGLRINTAADDASGLAVSEKLRAQISGLNKAATNAQDAISMLQTAEGAMGSMTSMVQRIRELAVQAGDPAYTSNDRAMLQLEVDQLKEEIDRVSSSTEFNTKKLLNGDAAALWSASNGNIEAIVKGAPVEGNYKISYDLDPGQNSVYKSNIMRLGEGEMSYNIDTNGTSITKFDNIQGMLRGSDMQVTVKGSAGTTAGSAVLGGGTGGMAGISVTNFASSSAASTASNNGYSIEIEALGDRSASGTAQIRFRVMNTSTGEISEWKTATVGTNGGVVGVTSSDTFKDLAGITENVFAGSGTATFGTNAWNSGDKMLVNVAGAKISAAGSAAIQVGSTGSTLYIPSNATNADTATTHTIYTAQMDKAGNVYYGSMDVTLEKGTKVTSGTATIDVLGAGDVASKYTKLSQLSQFTNADGRMVLDNTQEISIYAGNGNVAKVTLEGSDTIADLESKLTSALIDQLDMGADSTNTSATTVNNNLVKFVETPTGGDHAVEGTFVIQSAVLGEKSNLTFVGDEAVLSALGITQIQEAADSALNVRVTDAHTGEFIGEDIVTDNRLRNVIEGVDVIINPESAADVNFVDGKMVFTDKLGAEEAFLHIKDNATKAAVGANEGQVIDISIGRLDTVGMGIDGINVATFNDAQKAITKLDMALEQISKARATAGAQMNRLEYTITNLNTTRENMVSAESRIRDLDIAQASSDLAAQQVLLQSATAMLAQANQIPSYAAQLLQ